MGNQFWAVGCGLGCTVGKRGLGRFWATFFGRFFQFFHGQKNWKKFFWKHCSVHTEKLHKIKVKKYFVLFYKLNIFLTLKKWKNGPEKLLIISPDPFISQSSPELIFHIMKSLDQTSILLSVASAGAANDALGVGTSEFLGSEIGLILFKEISWNSKLQRT